MMTSERRRQHMGMAAQAVVAGVQLREVSLRHRTVVIQQGQAGVCVKAPHGSAAGDLRRERGVYQLLRAQDSPVTRMMPELADDLIDAEHVATRLVPNAQTLRRYLSGPHSRLQPLCRRLGECVALLHTTDRPGAHLLPAQPAAVVVSLLRPDRKAMIALSAASLRLVQTLQAGEACAQAFDELAHGAYAATLSHNDLKWDNILAHPADGENEPTQIKLIDWEMAGLGDPCWDVGTVLGEFLAFWALSIPMVAGEPPDTYMHLARYPLEDLQPAIGAFWQGYAATMGFDPPAARARLIRSTRYAGARLIQTAYERTQSMSRLTPQLYLLLQLSLNVLEQPEDAAEHLLGLTV